MQVLGTQIAYLPQDKIHTKIQEAFTEGVPCTIATLNPEILLEASENSLYRDVLNAQTAHTIDGIGLALVLRLKYKNARVKSIKRLTGVDLMHQILKAEANRSAEKKTVFLLSASNGLSTWSQTADAIRTKYPAVSCDGQDVTFQKDQPLGIAFSEVQRSKVVKAIERSGARYVFCNFGAPWQEYFLDQLKNARLEKPCVYIGVGGAFDYFSGKRSRAPHWMRQSGLEWLFRLVTQPRRLERIVSAVLVFPYKALTKK